LPFYIAIKNVLGSVIIFYNLYGDPIENLGKL